MTLAGQSLGRLQLLEQVGHGGFSVVYRAYDQTLDAQVAVKVLAENHSLDPDIRKRFLTEGRLLRKVSHPALLEVYDVGETDDLQPYLVLEFATGGTVAQRLATGAVATKDDLLAIVDTLVGSLTTLHEADIVHRDVSPANLLIDSPTIDQSKADGLLHPGERLLLSDLGLAKDLAASSGMTVGGGTPQFAAPEQGQPGLVEHTADIYAASAVLRHVAKGSPFEEVVVSATGAGLSPDPQGRPSSIAEWGRKLKTALEPDNPADGTDSSRTNGVKATIGRVAILAVGLFAGLAWYAINRAPNSKDTPTEASAAVQVYSAEGIGPGWTDQSWGFITRLDESGTIVLEPYGAASFQADDVVDAEADWWVLGEISGSSDGIAIRANDANQRAEEPCVMDRSQGLALASGNRTNFAVPLSLLGIEDGRLSRLSIMDTTGEQANVTIFELTVGEGETDDSADLRCG